jgi:hypothetical protein
MAAIPCTQAKPIEKGDKKGDNGEEEGDEAFTENELGLRTARHHMNCK